MPKDLLELRGFYQGAVSSPSEYDIPLEAASHSENVDPVSSNGLLQGIEDDEQLSVKTLRTVANINDDGNNVVVGWGIDDRIHINTNLDKTNTTNTFSQLSSNTETRSTHPQAFKFAKNVIFATGKEESNEVLFVGKDKHKRWGEEPSNNYFTEVAELKNGSIVSDFTKVIKAGNKLIGVKRGGVKIYSMEKSSSTNEWKVVGTSDAMSTTHTIESVCVTSDTNFIWVLMKKTSNNTFQILKVSVSAFSISKTNSINAWYRYASAGDDWVEDSSSLPTSMADIIEHGGKYFLTEKHTNSSTWESYLWQADIPTSSANVSVYDITPYHDLYKNPIGSWKLTDLNSTLNIVNESITGDDDTNVAFGVADVDKGLGFKFGKDNVGGTDLQCTSFSFNYDASNNVSDNSMSVLTNTQIDNSGNYSLLRTDNGMNIGTNRTAYTDSLNENSPAIIIPERNTIITVINPETSYSGNAKIIVIWYSNNGNTLNKTEYSLDNYDDIDNAWTIQQKQRLRESPKLSYDYANNCLFIGMRQLLAVPMVSYTWDGLSVLLPDFSNSDQLTGSNAIVDDQNPSGTVNHFAYIQTSLFNTQLSQWQMVVIGKTGGSSAYAEKYIAVDVTYNSSGHPTLSRNSSAEVAYATVSAGSFVVQMMQPSEDSPNIVERNNNNTDQLKYRQCTTTSRGTAVELKNAANETQSTYVPGWRLPFTVDKKKNLLFAFDKKNSTFPSIIRMYEISGTTTMTMELIGTVPLDSINDDGTGYQSLYANESFKNTLMVTESETTSGNETAKYDFIDYSYIQHPITIGDGSLLPTKESTWFLIGIEFDSDTYYRYGAGTNDTIKTRASLVYINWQSSNSNSNEGASATTVIRNKPMLHNSSFVKHAIITNTNKNIGCFTSLVHTTDNDDIIAYSSQLNNDSPNLYWTAIPNASAVNLGTYALSGWQVKELPQYTNITPCGFFDGTQFGFQLFERVDSGLWEFMKIANSSPFAFQSRPPASASSSRLPVCSPPPAVVSPSQPPPCSPPPFAFQTRSPASASSSRPPASSLPPSAFQTRPA